jgi:hypothetical protein
VPDIPGRASSGTKIFSAGADAREGMWGVCTDGASRARATPSRADGRTRNGAIRSLSCPGPMMVDCQHGQHRCTKTGSIVDIVGIVGTPAAYSDEGANPFGGDNPGRMGTLADVPARALMSDIGLDVGTLRELAHCGCGSSSCPVPRSTGVSFRSLQRVPLPVTALPYSGPECLNPPVVTFNSVLSDRWSQSTRCSAIVELTRSCRLHAAGLGERGIERRPNRHSLRMSGFRFRNAN